MINTDELGSNEKNFKDLFMINLVAVPGVVLSTIVVEVKFLGRKNSLIIGFILAGIFFFLSYAMFPTGFIWFIIISRMFTRLCVCLCW